MSILKIKDFPSKFLSIDERTFILQSLEMSSLFNVTDKRFIEIGTFHGTTAKLIVTALNKLQCESQFYSIDLNQPYWNRFGRNMGWHPKDYWMKNCGTINNGPCIPHFIEGKSQEQSHLFDSVCWCFIDGCHCYECVLGDLKAYCPKIVKGGFILMHDTQNWPKVASQWYHNKKQPRHFGVNKAIEDYTFLLQNFQMIWETKNRRGMQVWQRK
jgi:hypothetical protein